jgi:hypothetical protein
MIVEAIIQNHGRFINPLIAEDVAMILLKEAHEKRQDMVEYQNQKHGCGALCAVKRLSIN